MATDLILTEVHRVKDAVAAKYGYDARRLVKSLQRSQKRSGGKSVNFSSDKPDFQSQRPRCVLGGSQLTFETRSTR
jgi:hypothetical protein